jgi:hypothetical protein
MTAHIAADYMHLFALKGAEYGNIRQVTGMNDRVAVMERGLDIL